jgi:hypothetical protein
VSTVYGFKLGAHVCRSAANVIRNHDLKEITVSIVSFSNQNISYFLDRSVMLKVRHVKHTHSPFM